MPWRGQEDEFGTSICPLKMNCRTQHRCRQRRGNLEFFLCRSQIHPSASGPGFSHAKLSWLLPAQFHFSIASRGAISDLQVCPGNESSAESLSGMWDRTFYTSQPSVLIVLPPVVMVLVLTFSVGAHLQLIQNKVDLDWTQNVLGMMHFYREYLKKLKDCLQGIHIWKRSSAHSLTAAAITHGSMSRRCSMRSGILY